MSDKLGPIAQILETRCHDCFIPYEGFGVDLILPDQQWKLITTDGAKLLCGRCICKRVAAIGGISLLAWIRQ